MASRSRRTLLAAAAAGLACPAVFAQSSSATASGYPDRPVTLVVPFPPGGSADASGRSMAAALQGVLHQSFVIDNRAGAAGNIGVAYAAKARPDGYTLLLGTVGTQTINQFLYPNMAYDAEKDLVPIALIIITPNIIAVKADSSVRTLQDLIAAAREAKARGKPLSYATPGVGSSVHLSGAYFEQLAGIELLHVPFKGVAGSLPAVIGGQVDILMDNLPSTLAQVKDGSKVRAVVVTSPQRSPELPDVPTAIESGLPNLNVLAWFALYAPKGTPPAVVARLVEASKEACKAPAFLQTLAGMGAQPGRLFGEELGEFEKTERARWSAIVKARGIRLD